MKREAEAELAAIKERRGDGPATDAYWDELGEAQQNLKRIRQDIEEHEFVENERRESLEANQQRLDELRAARDGIDRETNQMLEDEAVRVHREAREADRTAESRPPNDGAERGSSGGADDGSDRGAGGADGEGSSGGDSMSREEIQRRIDLLETGDHKQRQADANQYLKDLQAERRQLQDQLLQEQTNALGNPDYDQSKIDNLNARLDQNRIDMTEALEAKVDADRFARGIDATLERHRDALEGRRASPYDDDGMGIGSSDDGPDRRRGSEAPGLRGSNGDGPDGGGSSAADAEDGDGPRNRTSDRPTTDEFRSPSADENGPRRGTGRGRGTSLPGSLGSGSSRGGSSVVDDVIEGLGMINRRGGTALGLVLGALAARDVYLGGKRTADGVERDRAINLGRQALADRRQEAIDELQRVLPELREREFDGRSPLSDEDEQLFRDRRFQLANGTAAARAVDRALKEIGEIDGLERELLTNRDTWRRTRTTDGILDWVTFDGDRESDVRYELVLETLRRINELEVRPPLRMNDQERALRALAADPNVRRLYPGRSEEEIFEILRNNLLGGALPVGEVPEPERVPEQPAEENEEIVEVTPPQDQTPEEPPHEARGELNDPAEAITRPEALDDESPVEVDNENQTVKVWDGETLRVYPGTERNRGTNRAAAARSRGSNRPPVNLHDAGELAEEVTDRLPADARLPVGSARTTRHPAGDLPDPADLRISDDATGDESDFADFDPSDIGGGDSQSLTELDPTDFYVGGTGHSAPRSIDTSAIAQGVYDDEAAAHARVAADHVEAGRIVDALVANEQEMARRAQAAADRRARQERARQQAQYEAELAAWQAHQQAAQQPFYDFGGGGEGYDCQGQCHEDW
jgi:hypothetical protein